MGKERNARGQFMRGNTIGEETRFQEGHDFSNKYKEEYCDKIIEYFSADSGKLPTLEGFASSIGVLVETLERWANANAQFKSSFELAKQMQKNKIITDALDRSYDGNFAKFLLVNCHGMREKSEVESTVQAKVESSIDTKTLAMIERVSKRIEDGKKG